MIPQPLQRIHLADDPPSHIGSEVAAEHAREIRMIAGHAISEADRLRDSLDIHPTLRQSALDRLEVVAAEIGSIASALEGA